MLKAALAEWEQRRGREWASDISPPAAAILPGWSPPRPPTSPSTPWLFLGSGRDAERAGELLRHGVATVLNVADDVPNFFEWRSLHDAAAAEDTPTSTPSIATATPPTSSPPAPARLAYVRLEMGDFGQDPDPGAKFEPAVAAVRAARGGGRGAVLVHCAAGQNRSVTVATAVLMAMCGWTCREAFDHVLRCRPGVLPLKDNRRALLEWERRLGGPDAKPSMLLDDFVTAANASRRRRGRGRGKGRGKEGERHAAGAPAPGAPPAESEAEAVRAVKEGDVAGLKAVLRLHPSLASLRVVDGERTLLHHAADWPGGWPHVADSITVLSTAGADVDARCSKDGTTGETPLHWAASSGDLAAVTALVRAGAALDVRGGCVADGTPLFLAVLYDKWPCAEHLRAAGAAVSLEIASAFGDLATARALLEATPPPDAATVQAALFHAVRCGHPEVVALLAAAGADVTAESPRNRDLLAERPDPTDAADPVVALLTRLRQGATGSRKDE